MGMGAMRHLSSLAPARGHARPGLVRAVGLMSGLLLFRARTGRRPGHQGHGTSARKMGFVRALPGTRIHRCPVCGRAPFSTGIWGCSDDGFGDPSVKFDPAAPLRTSTNLDEVSNGDGQVQGGRRLRDDRRPRRRAVSPTSSRATGSRPPVAVPERARSRRRCATRACQPRGRCPLARTSSRASVRRSRERSRPARWS